MCSTTHASQAPVRLLRRSERLGKPPEGGVLPPFLRGESWVLETPLESLPGPLEGVLSPPDPSWIPAGASGGSSVVPCKALQDLLEMLLVFCFVTAEDQDIIDICRGEGFTAYQDPADQLLERGRGIHQSE